MHISCYQANVLGLVDYRHALRLLHWIAIIQLSTRAAPGHSWAHFDLTMQPSAMPPSSQSNPTARKPGLPLDQSWAHFDSNLQTGRSPILVTALSAAHGCPGKQPGTMQPGAHRSLTRFALIRGQRASKESSHPLLHANPAPSSVLAALVHRRGVHIAAGGS